MSREDVENSTDESDEEAELFGWSRRTLLQTAGASAGGLLAGGSLLGSATAETADGNCVQVDLVTGTSEISDLSSSTYAGNGRLIEAQWAETVDNDTEGETTTRSASTNCGSVSVTSSVSIDFSAETASVTFDVSNCAGNTEDLLLVSYESPCNGAAASGGRWDPANAGQQTVFDIASTSVGNTTDKTLVVDVPPLAAGVPRRSSVEAYHPLDTDAGENCITGNPIGKNDDDDSISRVSGVDANTNDAFDLVNGANATDGLFTPNSGTHPINGSEGTVAAWFKWDSKDNYARVLQVGGSNSSSPSEGYSIEFDAGTNNLKFVQWGGGSDVIYGDDAGEDSLSSGNWYFVVAIVDANSPDPGDRFHIFDTNGELSGSPLTAVDGRAQSVNKVLQIGAGDGNNIDGQFDEVYAYSTALTESNVRSLYNATTTNTLRPVQNTTQNQNYGTIQGAIDDANSGDTIDVQPGSYSENVTIPAGTTGLTLQSTGDYTNTTISASGGVDVFADNTTVDGFTIEKTTDDGTGLVYVTGSGSTISNCFADGNGKLTGDKTGSGVIELENDATVQSNIIQNNEVGAVGVRLGVNSNGSTVTNNIIQHIGGGGGGHAFQGTDFDGSAVQLNNSSMTGHDIIENNYGGEAFDPEGDLLDATGNYFQNNQYGNTNGDVDASSKASSSVASGPSTN